ncbi:uncharacterized protein LOC143267337 isoform X1 [Peromyscus maniculatus bairdii]|uniref:uncharacterized protein LOC143267337 isoform X1 n=1 Tax=Peromyscus maniculatus bairdii TaxID=230844 RepID=UPI003FD5BFE3
MALCGSTVLRIKPGTSCISEKAGQIPGRPLLQYDLTVQSCTVTSSGSSTEMSEILLPWSQDEPLEFKRVLDNIKLRYITLLTGSVSMSEQTCSQ